MNLTTKVVVNARLKRMLLLLITSLLTLTCDNKDDSEVNPVPAAYRSLNDEAFRALDNTRAALNWNGVKGATLFGGELAIVSGGRGPSLLNPQVLESTKLCVQRFKELGFKQVTISLVYPMLNDDFPNATDYKNFYRDVVLYVRSLNMSTVIELTTAFSNPQFLAGLDPSAYYLAQREGDPGEGGTKKFFLKFLEQHRAMVRTIVDEIRPDYLTLFTEPGTQAENTGLPFTARNVQLGKTNYWVLLQHTLQDLDRKQTKLGAGIGTWESLELLSEASDLPIDYLEFHVYPVQLDLFDRVSRIAALASQKNKKLAVGESWCYKATQAELSQGVANSAFLLKRDVFDFWAPLDQAFVKTMVALGHRYGLLFTSFFNTQQFYYYLPYTEERDNRSYRELLDEFNPLSFERIFAGQPGATGLAFSQAVK